MASAKRADAGHTGKVWGRVALREELRRQQRRGRKIVFTNGCFDLLHAGHVRYLRAAKACGDLLVVALNSDASVRRLKGPDRPLVRLADRAVVMGALEMVDYVTSFGEPTPLRIIRELEPDVLVKGGDWKVGDIVGADDVLARGGQVRSLTFARGHSTTRLIERARSGPGT